MGPSRACAKDIVNSCENVAVKISVRATSVAIASPVEYEMALPPVPFVARAVINTLYDGEVCANVLHFRNVLADPTYSLQNLCEALAVIYVANVIPLVPATLEFINVTASDLDPTPVAPGSSTTGSNTFGAQSNEQLPNNVTACMTLRTNYGGRSGRGRLFHVGLGDDDLVANTLDPTLVTDLLAAYNAMKSFSASDGHQWKWVIVSYYGGGVARTTPLVNDVQLITCDGTADAMRKRLPNH